MDITNFSVKGSGLANIDRSIINVHNANNGFSTHYTINSPFEITYEYCSGIADSDFLNVLVLSPHASSFASTSMKKYLPYNKRALHRHDFYEFMLVLDGQILHRIENKEYSYHAGSGCFINRNIRHTEVFTGTVKVLFIGLTTQFISEILEFYMSACFKEEQHMLENSIFQFMKSDIQSSDEKEYLDFFPAFQNVHYLKTLHNIADMLLKTAVSPKFGASYILRGIICRLIQYLTDKDHYHVAHIRLNSREDFVIFSRINHLLEDTYGRISRKELENTLNYSGSYINKIVKKYTGMSLFDYSMTFCLQRVEYLLTNTNRSIASIMSELRFTNTTHFYTLFEEKYGLTPGKYRKSCRT